MKRVLEGVEPKLVFSYFEDLTRIPRGSGNEKEVVDYLQAFAAEHGYATERDALNNLLIRVPASPGYEDHPVLILQGHVDMVCEKNAGTEFDFEKDPIRVEIDGDKVIAKDTTLGADDGMGVALAMAVAADPDCKHPPLEIVCTTDEERGMTGVEAFDASVLKGRRLINLDADDEGVFVVGCAGGPVVRTELPIAYADAPAGSKAVRIEVKGLLGGHSGEDIHRGRANSNKLMNRILLEIGKNAPYALAELSGGLKYNAIPREAAAVVLYAPADEDRVTGAIRAMEKNFRKEYRTIENDLEIAVTETDTPAQVLDAASLQRILDFVEFSECGIIRMNPELAGVVESSVSIGVIRLEGDKAVIQTMTRSSAASIYWDTYHKIVRLAELLGGTTTVMNNCPEWEYDPDSELKAIFGNTYRELYGRDATYLVLHAGLECGEFGQKIPEHVDMIAAGPDIRNLHAPGEYVTISSTQKFWEFFKAVLAKL